MKHGILTANCWACCLSCARESTKFGYPKNTCENCQIRSGLYARNKLVIVLFDDLCQTGQFRDHRLVFFLATDGKMYARFLESGDAWQDV